jgi:hypothetical protein
VCGRGPGKLNRGRKPRHTPWVGWPTKIRWAALGVVGCLAAGVAHGAPPKKGPPKGAAPPAMTLPADLEARLRSGDRAAFRSAVDDIRLAGKDGKSAVAGLLEALSRGLPADLAEAVLDTLTEVEGGHAPEAVVPYASHRVLKVRRAAVRCLGFSSGTKAIDALRSALLDDDPTLHDTAAEGLAKLGAKRASGDLLAALDRGVLAAATPFAALCASPECDQLDKRIGKISFGALGPAVMTLLLRKGDVSEQTKEALVRHLDALATPDARALLQEARTKVSPKDSPQLAKLLEKFGGAQ